MVKFILNNRSVETSISSGTTLLDFIRYNQHLVGTKIGCREGDCGACTVLVGELQNGVLSYQSMTSCLTPLGNAHGKHIVTVEGLNMDELTPVQKAIVEEGGTQCGFCTVGFVVSLSGYTLSKQAATYENAIAAIDGNICRCTGYKSLERAAARITEEMANRDTQAPIQWLVENKYLPHYFVDIENRLQELQDLAPIDKSNGEVLFVGGGTDLFVQRPEQMPDAPIQHVFDLTNLKGITQRDGHVYMGAATTAEDIQRSPIMQDIFPNLRAHIKLVSSTPIRNMGTVAGNLVNASPIGDLTIFFLALDSSILLNKKGEKRIIKLRNFYKGYKQLDKAADENVEAIKFEIPEKGDYFNFEKVCKRTHLDIASVNSACSLSLKDGVITKAHLSAGGVGPIPKYLTKSVAALIGKPANETTIKEVNEIIQSEISPISDARGTKEYKRLLLRQLFYAHFISFFPQELSIETLA